MNPRTPREESRHPHEPAMSDDADIPFGFTSRLPLRPEPSTEEEWEAFWDSIDRELRRQPKKQRKVIYAAYLRSAEWGRTRDLALEYYGGNCCLCHSTDNLEVHHRTYERLGRERLADLTVLCDPCHERYHLAA